jgi:hypothetical protein
MRHVLFAVGKRELQQDANWEGGKRKAKENLVAVRNSIALPDVTAMEVSGVENVW